MILSSTASAPQIGDLPLEAQQMIFDEYLREYTGHFVAEKDYQDHDNRMDVDQEEVVPYYNEAETLQALGPRALLLTNKAMLAAARPRAALRFPLLVKLKAPSSVPWHLILATAASVAARYDSGAPAEQAPEHALCTPAFRDSSIESVDYRGRPHVLDLAPYPFGDSKLLNTAAMESLTVEVRKNDCFAFLRMLRDYCPTSLKTYRYRVLAVENCMESSFQTHVCYYCRVLGREFIQLGIGAMHTCQSWNLHLEKSTVGCGNAYLYVGQPTWKEFEATGKEEQMKFLGRRHSDWVRRWLFNSIAYNEWLVIDVADKRFAAKLAEHRAASMVAKHDRVGASEGESKTEI